MDAFAINTNFVSLKRLSLKSKITVISDLSNDVEHSIDDVADDIIVVECDTDQVVSSLTNVHSQYRSKVGSISAAEAVKSLQQPILVKTEPVPPSIGKWFFSLDGN